MPQRGSGRKNYLKVKREQSIPNYHEKAQAFIKKQRSVGMDVKAVGGKLVPFPRPMGDSSLRRLEKPEKKWNTRGYNFGVGVGP